MINPGVFITFLATIMLGSGGVSYNNTKGSSDNGVVKFNLDGTEWISGPPGPPELKYEEEATTDGKTLVRIEAFSANGSYLALTIYSTTGIMPGSYPINEPGMSGFYKDDYNEGGGYLTTGMRDNPGVVTITSLNDKDVKGTFSFQLRNSGDPEDIRHITEGSFNVRFSSY